MEGDLNGFGRGLGREGFDNFGTRTRPPSKSVKEQVAEFDQTERESSENEVNEFLETVYKEAGIESGELESLMREKSHSRGLERDLSWLYENRETISSQGGIVDIVASGTNEGVKAHKTVLFARAGLYRSLIMSTQVNPGDKIPDFSGLEKRQLEILVEYLYTGKIQKTLPLLQKEDSVALGEVVDYFQLPRFSSLFELASLPFQVEGEETKNEEEPKEIEED